MLCGYAFRQRTFLYLLFARPPAGLACRPRGGGLCCGPGGRPLLLGPPRRAARLRRRPIGPARVIPAAPAQRWHPRWRLGLAADRRARPGPPRRRRSRPACLSRNAPASAGDGARSLEAPAVETGGLGLGIVAADVMHEAARSSSKAKIRSTRFLNLSRSAAFQAGVVADRWRRLGGWVS